MESFQLLLDNTKWYTYFEQINRLGEDLGLGAVTAMMVK